VIQRISDRNTTMEGTVQRAANRLRGAGVTEETAAGIVLAIVEALGNVARHARHAAEPVRFELLMEIQPTRITIDVVDYGPGFELTKQKMPDPFCEAGRGIALMQRICDSIDYCRGASGNHLILQKHLGGGVGFDAIRHGSGGPPIPKSSHN
jgi:anti-sigma regulatory factor (Ser/Thr protein kinase)